MREFQRLLAPLKRKMAAERFLKWLLRLESGASVVCLGLVLLSKWVRMDLLWQCCAGLWLLAAAAAAVLAFWLRPVTLTQAAQEADALGGQERMITTLELLEKKEYSTMEKMAVDDGVKKAEQTDFAKAHVFRFSRKMLIILGLSLVLTAGAGFVPIQREERAEIYAKAQLERIEQAEAELKREELTREEQDLLDELTKSLRKELKLAKTEKEAKEAVQQAQQEMKKLEKESVSKDLRELAQNIEHQESTRSLAEALRNADSQQMQQALTALQQMLTQMSAQEIAELAAQMGEAADRLDDQQLKEALEALQKALEEGMDPSEAMGELQQAAAAQMASGANLRAGLQKMNLSLAQKGGTLRTGQEQQTLQAVEADGQGQGSGGQGQGEGSGNGGYGQGSGGQGRGFGQGNAEEIYSRTAAGMEGENVQLSGEDTENGSTVISQHRTMGQAGESMPYDQVYLQYQQEAMSSLENSQVPYGMRTLVSDYFSGLER
ncbi:hypothetical protein H9X85_07365 [Anaerotignum lactatifermentans]|uniref:Phage tail tape measure protein n=1 Tax=Anaerotignum lactatifermentans TaxID=160404 RepID=A0ABS2G9F0_9FIRM|nr:hypothetical protein [Anaerotignum lactatifermentans]MBM6829449.1 hypothetical protein [Anaerotignum lactatifermentans]MBM6877807.1 hypothetical protein [Anaerotignum lactatifermentans]MBM6951026.1 hypothetical protein [Anaerotignum lactatifermentans]